MSKPRRIRMSYQDWGKRMKPQFAEILARNDAILNTLGPYVPKEPESIITRMRNVVGRRLAKIAFTIAPDVRDDYYD